MSVDTRTADPVELLLGSPARARLLIHFLVHPDADYHVRALQEHLGVGTRSLYRELERLEALDLVRRERDGRKVVYRPRLENPLWRAIELLIRRTARPELVLQDALADLRDDLEGAFVYGSVARGEAREDSDLDVMALTKGDGSVRERLSAETMDAAQLLGREINLETRSPGDVFSPSPASPYLERVRDGAKRWIFGEEEVTERRGAAGG